jgi:hypothetical protein
MSDPLQAAQNSAYWGAINGPGLSNPGFYPGGGTATSLQIPGGIPFNSGRSGPSVVPPGFMNNRVGPLSPANYNWFFNATAKGRPPISYQQYLDTFPQGYAGPPLGGTGSALGGGVKNQ